MNDILQNYTFGLPVAASTYAAEIDRSLHILHWGMYVIFGLWGIFFVYCLIRFRHRKSAVPGPRGGQASPFFSYLPDAMVLGFELWLVFLFGLPIWSHVKEEFPEEERSEVVELVAEQFAWGFQYAGPDGKFGKRDPKQITPGNTLGIDANDPAAADDVVSLNELHVPLGKPTILKMTSKDVIHSFFVPEFRTKQDVVPGMEQRLWFEPTRAGRYEIGCAQLCGLGHYRMRGDVIVHEAADYEAWLTAKQAEKAAAQEEASE
jgi:cytochrome c oxidase subunit II